MSCRRFVSFHRFVFCRKLFSFRRFVSCSRFVLFCRFVFFRTVDSFSVVESFSSVVSALLVDLDFCKLNFILFISEVQFPSSLRTAYYFFENQYHILPIRLFMPCDNTLDRDFQLNRL